MQETNQQSYWQMAHYIGRRSTQVCLFVFVYFVLTFKASLHIWNMLQPANRLMEAKDNQYEVGNLQKMLKDEATLH